MVVIERCLRYSSQVGLIKGAFRGGLATQTGDFTLGGYSGSWGHEPGQEDMEHSEGLNGRKKPSDACIGYYEIQSSEEEKWRNMEDLMKTFSVGEMEDVALDMMKRFKENSGKEYSSPRLDEEAAGNGVFEDYRKSTEQAIEDELRKNGGDVYKLKVKPVKTGLIAFNRWVDRFKGLQITVNQVSEITVEVLSYDIDMQTGKYTMSLRYSLLDDFGLDAHDVCKYGADHLGFQSWWMLQHCYDYKPFQTRITVTVSNVTGSIK